MLNRHVNIKIDPPIERAHGSGYRLSVAKGDIGRRLKTLRKRAKKKQQELASFLGLDETGSISRYERGKVTPTRETIEKIALFYGVPYDAIDPANEAFDRRENAQKPRLKPDGRNADVPDASDTETLEGGSMAETPDAAVGRAIAAVTALPIDQQDVVYDFLSGLRERRRGGADRNRAGNE